jgi:hypothetical protein
VEFRLAVMSRDKVEVMARKLEHIFTTVEHPKSPSLTFQITCKECLKPEQIDSRIRTCLEPDLLALLFRTEPDE